MFPPFQSVSDACTLGDGGDDTYTASVFSYEGNLAPVHRLEVAQKHEYGQEYLIPFLTVVSAIEDELLEALKGNL